MSRRTDRVSVVVQEEVSRLLIEELSDPRLARLVTISRVDVSADLQHAMVMVTVLGGEQEQQEAILGLESASSFLRRSLGHSLKLRRTPELRFMLDPSIQEGDQVLALLDNLRPEQPPEQTSAESLRDG